MFGFDLNSFKHKLALLQELAEHRQFHFCVDDIDIVVAQQQILQLDWKVEPSPEELRAAINEAFKQLALINAKQRETLKNEVLEGLPYPIRTMLNSQLSTLLL